MKNKRLAAGLFHFLIALLIPALVHGSTVEFTAVEFTESAATQFTVTPSAGVNGTISPSGIQQVNSGGSLTFTATPNLSYLINQWIVDEVVVQTGGTSFILANITANHNVNVTFKKLVMTGLYVGAANGKVYYSTDNGANWVATPQAPDGTSPVNGLSATPTRIYVGSGNGSMYYSADRGSNWISMGTPDGSAITGVFGSSNILYAGTQNGNIYYLTAIGGSWTAITSPDRSAVYSIFAINNALYAGTANGFVYYSTNAGKNWTAINGKPDINAIMNVFVANNTLYINTANENVYTSTSLTGGGSWTSYAQTVYSLFVNSDASKIYAGTQGGSVFSLPGGTTVGFVTYSPINRIYLAN